MRLVTEFFTVTSNRTQITFSEKYKNVRKMKVHQLSYKTASTGNHSLLVIVSGWASHRYNTSNGTIYGTFRQILPRATLTEIDYESPEDRWDEERNTPTDLGVCTLELYINGDSTNADITALNPVYIEFKLWLED